MDKAELGGRSSAYKLGEAELELERRGGITKAPDRAPWATLHRPAWADILSHNLQCHAAAHEATVNAFLLLPH